MKNFNNFKWNQRYLSRGSNSLYSASNMMYNQKYYINSRKLFFLRNCDLSLPDFPVRGKSSPPPPLPTVALLNQLCLIPYFFIIRQLPIWQSFVKALDRLLWFYQTVAFHGRIQEFVQGGLKFFIFPGGGLSTRWGLKTPWNQ